MIDFLSIILLVFGVLQIILFFKMWIMTSDVSKIKEVIQLPVKRETEIIYEAQLKTLNGEKNEAFNLYQKAFLIEIIDLYQTVNAITNPYSDKNEAYKKEYENIAKKYTNIAKNLSMSLDIEKYNSLSKVRFFIGTA